MPAQPPKPSRILTAIVLRTAAAMSKLSKKIHGLHTLPAFKLVLALLVVVVLLSCLGHHYLSNMAPGDSGARRPWSKYDQIGDGHIRVLGPNNYPFRGRQIEGYDGLDSDPVGGRPLSVSYQKEIEELRHIKASVSNELRELESTRLRLQATIQQYRANVDELKLQHAALTKEIGQVKLSLDQIKFERDESLSYIPNIRAPVQIIRAASSLWSNESADTPLDQRRETFSPARCSMETCFDFSRCSLVSGFPVYFYDPSVHRLTLSGVEQGLASDSEGEVLSAVQQFFDKSVYRTTQPDKACVFIVLLHAEGSDPPTSYTAGSLSFPSAPEVERFLYSLPHWAGDGRNHVLLHLAKTESRDPLSGVNTGRALVAKTSFTDTAFREGFDVVIPPNTGPSSGENLWKDLPSLSPVRRKLLLSFWGEFVQPPEVSSSSVHSRYKGTARKNRFLRGKDQYIINKNIRHRKPLAVVNQHIPSSKKSPFYPLERAVVSSLESFPNSPQGEVLVDTSCRGEKLLHSGYTNLSLALEENSMRAFTSTDWALCATEHARKDILLHSSFSLVLAPLNSSIDSTVALQSRVLEALSRGSIPVVLGSSYKSPRALPFAESLQWKTAAITLPVPRVTEVPFYLQSFSAEDIAALRLQGREFYNKYLGSTDAILETLLAVLRQRLDIPAHPIPEEPSPSAFPEGFTPQIYEGPDVEPETDEVLGPIEAPFASETFRRNFSTGLLSDMFNRFGDPFHLYPHTPFQPVLPSESKFLGSNYGFRPINRGAGGDGIDFSQALGGNVPREQFTIVMLTYQRETVLLQALQRFKGLPFLNRVVVVWNSETLPTADLKWPQIGVPIKVVKTQKNSLNNRFLPYSEIETEAILSIDDDAHLRHDEIVFGFRVWREERARIVGFPGRYHAWDLQHQSWNYNSNYSCELSMVLTGAAFFHKYYAYLYSYVMPQAIRDKVDEYLNCEDIAMNFLVSHITRKPPVKVTSRWTFRCPGCPTTLFNNPSHFEERHRCINFFSQVYGYTPLLNTQFRVDSVLFKTRISHDKTKCFKYI